MIDGEAVVRITGEFLELERPTWLRFSWQADLGGGFDGVVTVTVEPGSAATTVMTIEHVRLPAPWRADMRRPAPAGPKRAVRSRAG